MSLAGLLFLLASWVGEAIFAFACQFDLLAVGLGLLGVILAERALGAAGTARRVARSHRAAGAGRGASGQGVGGLRPGALVALPGPDAGRSTRRVTLAPASMAGYGVIRVVEMPLSVTTRRRPRAVSLSTAGGDGTAALFARAGAPNRAAAALGPVYCPEAARSFLVLLLGPRRPAFAPQRVCRPAARSAPARAFGRAGGWRLLYAPGRFSPAPGSRLGASLAKTVRGPAGSRSPGHRSRRPRGPAQASRDPASSATESAGGPACVFCRGTGWPQLDALRCSSRTARESRRAGSCYSAAPFATTTRLRGGRCRPSAAGGEVVAAEAAGRDGRGSGRSARASPLRPYSRRAPRWPT